MSNDIENLVWWYLSEKKVVKWSGKVKTKFHPKEGIFKEGSPEEIATEITKDNPDLQTAMSRLNFFLNRAGKGLSSTVRANVEAAKKIVHNKLSKKEQP